MNRTIDKLIHEYREIIKFYIYELQNNFDSKDLKDEFERKLRIAYQNIEKINNLKIANLKRKFLFFLETQFKKELWIKNNSENEYINKINQKFMYGIEEPWCNNQGVTILPYVLKNNEYYFLQIYKENNPLFKNKQISQYSTITGGIENSNPYQTVINEMLEETGIDGRDEKVKIHYLGKHYANKSSTKLLFFYGVDLTKLNLDLSANYKGTGDGSIGEKEISAKFISHSEFIKKTNDTLCLTVYAKLSFNIYKNIQKWWDIYEKENNQKSELEKLNNNFWEECNKIDQSELFTQSIVKLEEKSQEITKNYWNQKFKLEINSQSLNSIKTDLISDNTNSLYFLQN